MVINLKFNPLLSEFKQAKINIEEKLKILDIPYMEMMDIMLAIDESITNIISHGYDKVTSDDYIEVNINMDHEKVIIKITDSGREYDFHSTPAPDIRKNLTGNKKGGFGVHLIKSVMNKVEHERNNNKNILTLIKKITRES